jgi:UDP-glucose 4-epimerase
MTTRIAVTGGAGFIGSHVVDVLADAGNDVLVIDDFSTGREENLERQRRNPNVTVERADITDAPTMLRLLRGVDLVYHLAVQCLRVSLYDPTYVHAVNATGTLNLCIAAREQNVKRFVYVSSSEVYGSARRVPMREDHPLHPTTPYAASKLAGEAYALSFANTHGLSVVVVRPFNAYGPREHHEGASGEVIPRFTLRAMCGEAPVIFGDGEQTRDFTWVEDTAAGIVRAGTCDRLAGKVVNIAFGQEVTIRRVAELVLQAVGRTDLSVVHAEDRPGDVRRHFADVSRARRLLGISPSVSIEEGISRYVAWLRSVAPDPKALLAEQDAVNWRPREQRRDETIEPAEAPVAEPTPVALPPLAWQPVMAAAS